MADYKSKFTGEQIDALLDKVGQEGSGGGSSDTMEYLDVSGLDDDIKIGLSLLCCIAKSRTNNSWYILSPIAYDLFTAKPVALGFDTNRTLSMEGLTGTPFELFEMLGFKDLVDSLPRLTKEEFYNLNA